MKKVIIDRQDTLDDFKGDFIYGPDKGIIELPIPVLNITKWYSDPLGFASVLGLTAEELERLVYFTDIVVIESGSKEFNIGQIIPYEVYDKLEDKSVIEYLGGAEAIEWLYSRIDTSAVKNSCREEERRCMAKLIPLYDEIEPLEEKFFEIDEDSEEGRRYSELCEEIDVYEKILRETRKTLDFLIEDKEGYVMRSITLFPLEMRGQLKKVTTPYAVDDICRLAVRLLNRCKRVEKLMEVGAPEIIMINEKRMLQEYVDALVANGLRGKPITFHGSKLISLSDLLLRSYNLI